MATKRTMLSKCLLRTIDLAYDELLRNMFTSLTCESRNDDGSTCFDILRMRINSCFGAHRNMIENEK